MSNISSQRNILSIYVISSMRKKNPAKTSYDDHPKTHHFKIWKNLFIIVRTTMLRCDCEIVRSTMNNIKNAFGLCCKDPEKTVQVHDLSCKLDCCSYNHAADKIDGSPVTADLRKPGRPSWLRKCKTTLRCCQNQDQRVKTQKRKTVLRRKEIVYPPSPSENKVRTEESAYQEAGLELGR